MIPVVQHLSNAGGKHCMRLGPQSDLIYDGREEEKRSTNPHLLNQKLRDIASLVQYSREMGMAII